MSLDDKIDKLLEDLAIVKTVTQQHTQEFIDLKAQLKPVFFHVTGMQWVIRLTGGVIAVGTLVVGTIALMK